MRFVRISQERSSCGLVGNLRFPRHQKSKISGVGRESRQLFSSGNYTHRHVRSGRRCDSPVTGGRPIPAGQVASLWLDGPVSPGPEVGSVEASVMPRAAPLPGVDRGLEWRTPTIKLPLSADRTGTQTAQQAGSITPSRPLCKPRRRRAKPDCLRDLRSLSVHAEVGDCPKGARSSAAPSRGCRSLTGSLGNGNPSPRAVDDPPYSEIELLDIFPIDR